MKKLMGAYCDRQGVSMESIRFLYNGQRMQNEQTPEMLDMEDNDIIDAVLAQSKNHFLLFIIFLFNFLLFFSWWLSMNFLCRSSKCF